MIKEYFKQNISELIGIIKLSINNNAIIPSLILLYSGIDIFGWLSRPKNIGGANANTFIKWVEQYLLPDSGLQCNAIDLYSARCSIIHSYTSESFISYKGKAKEIYYAWGNADEKNLQTIIDSSHGKNKVIAIHINALSSAFFNGVEKFIQALDKDKNLAAMVYDRAQKFFHTYVINYK